MDQNRHHESITGSIIRNRIMNQNHYNDNNYDYDNNNHDYNNWKFDIQQWTTDSDNLLHSASLDEYESTILIDAIPLGVDIILIPRPP